MLSTSAIGMSKPTSVYKTNHGTLLLLVAVVAVVAVAAVAAVTVAAVAAVTVAAVAAVTVAAVAAVAAVTVVAGHLVTLMLSKTHCFPLENASTGTEALLRGKAGEEETRPKEPTRCCLSLSEPKQWKEQG